MKCVLSGYLGISSPKMPEYKSVDAPTGAKINSVLEKNTLERQGGHHSKVFDHVLIFPLGTESTP